MHFVQSYRFQNASTNSVALPRIRRIQRGCRQFSAIAGFAAVVDRLGQFTELLTAPPPPGGAPADLAVARQTAT